MGHKPVTSLLGRNHHKQKRIFPFLKSKPKHQQLNIMRKNLDLTDENALPVQQIVHCLGLFNCHRTPPPDTLTQAAVGGPVLIFR